MTSPKIALTSLLAAAIVVSADTAHAAEVDFGWVVELIAPFVESMLIGVIAIAVGWLASRINRWLGLSIDKKHAQALHEAVGRGVRHALSKLRADMRGRAVVDVESRLVAETAIYLERLMPDALRHFGLDDETLDRLIRTHIGPDTLRWAEASEAQTSRPPKPAHSGPIQKEPSI